MVWRHSNCVTQTMCLTLCDSHFVTHLSNLIWNSNFYRLFVDVSLLFKPNFIIWGRHFLARLWHLLIRWSTSVFSTCNPSKFGRERLSLRESLSQRDTKKYRWFLSWYRIIYEKRTIRWLLTHYIGCMLGEIFRIPLIVLRL